MLFVQFPVLYMGSLYKLPVKAIVKGDGGNASKSL